MEEETTTTPVPQEPAQPEVPVEAGGPPAETDSENQGPVSAAPEPTSEPEATPNNQTVTITEVMAPEPDPEVSKATFDTKSFLASLFPKLKEKLAFRTEKRLAKIIELAREKASKGESIQNDDVEKLLHISHRSASRYLKKLIEQGKLKIIGDSDWPKYTPN